MTKGEGSGLSKNWHWLLAFVAIVLVLVLAIFLNIEHTDNTATNIINTIDIDDGDTKINWSRYTPEEIELTESLKITKPGIYHLTGSLEGSISVNVLKEDPVRIILDNVTIKNESGPAIACYEADDLVIELIGENLLEDGSYYSADYDEDVTGVIYSKADLTFQGDGVLGLVANYQDGIVSKDDLKIKSGTYNIVANDDGIRGKDSVYILNGDFMIVAKADAIKSSNENIQGKGFVLIEDGEFSIKASAKGIKATNSILIKGGNFIIDSYDDAVHSNNYIGIKDGSFEISSNDDGMHADKELIIDGGTVDVKKAYEGLEAQAITINGGKISLETNDDGINAGGGADESSANRVGAGVFDMNTDCVLTINGGEVYVNASGDGVDSNGYLYFNGGTTIIDGPTSNGNGALDSGSGIIMNGGEVIAVGASGMAETLGSTSNVHNISVYFTSTLSSGTEIVIKNSHDEVVLSHTAAKTFNHLSAGTTKFELGSTYTIYIDDEEYEEFTISEITTVIGNTNSGFGPNSDQDKPQAPPDRKF